MSVLKNSIWFTDVKMNRQNRFVFLPKDFLWRASLIFFLHSSGHRLRELMTNIFPQENHICFFVIQKRVFRLWRQSNENEAFLRLDDRVLTWSVSFLFLSTNGKISALLEFELNIKRAMLKAISMRFSFWLKNHDGRKENVELHH